MQHSPGETGFVSLSWLQALVSEEHSLAALHYTRAARLAPSSALLLTKRCATLQIRSIRWPAHWRNRSSIAAPPVAPEGIRLSLESRTPDMSPPLQSRDLSRDL